MFRTVLADLQIMGARDVLSFIAGGGIAVYLFKLYRKGQEDQIEIMKGKIKELEDKIEIINTDYITEIKARASAEAENKELRRTIKRLEQDLKKFEEENDSLKKQEDEA
jgi:septal ring factor EnvC (AmiA/AmiB activator)